MANRYQPIADDLRRLIQSSKWQPGDRLPPERVLAARYRVSTPTLRNALEVLQGEGLVEKRHGIGNFVQRPKQRIRYTVGECEIESRGTPESATSVSFESAVVVADGRLSSLLGVSTGTSLTECTFIGHQGGEPRSLARVYVPYAVAKLGALVEGGSPWGNAVRDLLSLAGVQVVASTEKVTSRFPTTEEAHLLHITARAPVLAVERLSFAVDGRIVECALLVLPGDRSEALFTTQPVNESQAADR